MTAASIANAIRDPPTCASGASSQTTVPQGKGKLAARENQAMGRASA